MHKVSTLRNYRIVNGKLVPFGMPTELWQDDEKPHKAQVLKIDDCWCPMYNRLPYAPFIRFGPNHEDGDVFIATGEDADGCQIGWLLNYAPVPSDACADVEEAYETAKRYVCILEDEGFIS